MVNYLIPFGIGSGLAILKTYLGYRQDKKRQEIINRMVSHCESLERKIEQIPPGELRRRLGVK